MAKRMTWKEIQETYPDQWVGITVPDDESVSRRLTIKDKNGRLYVPCSSAE